jgi:hypothetical protein
MAYELATRQALETLNVNPKQHLPKDGATNPAPFTLPRGQFKGTTIRVWVKPQTADYSLSRNNRYKHRLMAECPHCSKVVSFGRIEQHLVIHR